MKTTVIIDDALITDLKREAARQRRTMSDLIEEALMNFLHRKKIPGRLPKLPRYDSGGYLVDISDRDALYDAMEDR